MSELKYGPERRNGIRFGFGEQASSVSNNYSEEIDLLNRTREEGWKNGCPIAKELTAEDSPYGVEWMLNRYKQTNHYFRLIREMAGKERLPVLPLFKEPQLRQYTEPVGHHEPESVPLNHKVQISPMSGIDGYASSRLAIAIAEKADKDTAIKFVRYSMVSTYYEPRAYLAQLADFATEQFRIDPASGVLHHVYPAGILTEENCRTTFYNLAKMLSEYAPTVWKTYASLTPSQKKELAIADIPTII